VRIEFAKDLTVKLRDLTRHWWGWGLLILFNLLVILAALSLFFWTAAMDSPEARKIKLFLIIAFLCWVSYQVGKQEGQRK
jgi:hypothetical protein